MEGRQRQYYCAQTFVEREDILFLSHSPTYICVCYSFRANGMETLSGEIYLSAYYAALASNAVLLSGSLLKVKFALCVCVYVCIQIFMFHKFCDDVRLYWNDFFVIADLNNVRIEMVWWIVECDQRCLIYRLDMLLFLFW